MNIEKLLLWRTRFLLEILSQHGCRWGSSFWPRRLCLPPPPCMEKAHEIGEKEACLGMRTGRLPIQFFLRLRVYVTGSSTRCCSHRATIHSCNRGRSAHRRSLDKNKQKPHTKTPVLFFFPPLNLIPSSLFGTEWAEEEQGGCRTSEGFQWHGVLKREPPSPASSRETEVILCIMFESR